MAGVGQGLKRHLTKNIQMLFSCCTDIGYALNRNKTNVGNILNRPWPGFGRLLDQRYTVNGKAMKSCLIYIGHKI